MIRFAIFIALILIMLAWAFGGMAQPKPPCDERSEVISRMANEFMEALVWIGISTGDGPLQGKIVEVYTNPDTGTFTITWTAPDNPDQLCVFLFGEGAAIIPYLPGDPS